MTQKITFTLFNNTGSVLTGTSPTVVALRRSDGSAVTPVPSVVERSQGFYEFSVDPDALGPVAYAVNCGPDSSVKYLTGGVGELVVFAMYDYLGELDATRNPVFSVFSDGESALTPPVITNLGSGLFGFWPTLAPGKLVQYVVGDDLNTHYGTLGSTQLTNAVPPAGSEIQNTQVLTFDVKDTETHLGRVLIAVEYAALGGATELVWDGSVALGSHLVTSLPIPDGRRYSVLRSGGWPASPKLRVFLTNYGGREL